MKKTTLFVCGITGLTIFAFAAGLYLGLRLNHPPRHLARPNAEIPKHYEKATPDVQEYVRWTTRTFGPAGLWLADDAFAKLSPAEHEAKAVYLAKLLEDSDYGRSLCQGLAEAGALKDKRLVPGLMKVAAYQKEGVDYDCRPKWMAVAALSRQDAMDAAPLLVSLVDHGNENTRMWARAALARLTGQDFKADKQAWAKWWQSQGHPPVDAKYLVPFVMPKK